MKTIFQILLITIAGLAATCSAYAQQNELTEFIWEKRVLLGHPSDLEELELLSSKIELSTPRLEERKIQVVLNWRNRLRYFPDPKVKVSHTDVLKMLAKHQGDYLLVGLDGTIKQQYSPDDFDLENVFKDIDLMPMRQADIQAVEDTSLD